jgi:hypothetical protein
MFDPDVQIEKKIAFWKCRDENNDLESISMAEIITIIPYKLNYIRDYFLSSQLILFGT